MELTTVVVESWPIEKWIFQDHVVLHHARHQLLRCDQRARLTNLKRAVAESNAERLASIEVNCMGS